MKTGLVISSSQYFNEMVDEALKHRHIDTRPIVRTYLAQLLQFHINAENLFETQSAENRPINTLAEMYLSAQHLENRQKIDLLKKLADRALYMSGFFAESFARKIIDVDYYVDMGETAYRDLSHLTNEEMLSGVYKTFSERFIEFVDVLSYISHGANIQSNEDILKLYDVYMKTGSEVARQKLTEIGVTTVPRTGKGNKAA